MQYTYKIIQTISTSISSLQLRAASVVVKPRSIHSSLMLFFLAYRVYSTVTRATWLMKLWSFDAETRNISKVGLHVYGRYIPEKLHRYRTSPQSSTKLHRCGTV